MERCPNRFACKPDWRQLSDEGTPVDDPQNRTSDALREASGKLQKMAREGEDVGMYYMELVQRVWPSRTALYERLENESTNSTELLHMYSLL